MIMDSLGKILETIPFLNLDGLLQDGVAAVNLLDHLVDHQTGRVVLEFAGLEILVCPLDCASTVVFAG